MNSSNGQTLALPDLQYIGALPDLQYCIGILINKKYNRNRNRFISLSQLLVFTKRSMGMGTGVQK